MNVLDEDGKPVTDPSVPKFWGETDAFFQHHDRFMQYYRKHYMGATRPHFGHNGRSDNRDIYSNY